MLKNVLSTTLLLVFFSLQAQEKNGDKFSSTIYCKNSNAYHITQKAEQKEIIHTAKNVHLNTHAPFIAFSIRWEEDTNISKSNTQIQVRFSSDSINWQNWQPIEPFHEADENPTVGISKLYYIDATNQYYQLKVNTNLIKQGKAANNIFVHAYAPSSNTTTTTTSDIQPVVFGGTSCPCPIPSFTNRVQWGNPQGATSAVTGTTTVSHMIVHHAAGSNTSSNWAATVKAIYDFHTITNRYTDIGYNWLIAPDGTLFEGRGRTNATVTGAHFCGANGNTMGVCMLGDYTSVNITTAARNTLMQLLAWMDCSANLNALGTTFHAGTNRTLNVISGHRDGCATSCPGDTFYPNLVSLRTDVNNHVNGGCGVTAVVNIEGVKDVSVLPNPSTNGNMVLSITTSTSKTMQYIISNLQGKEIYTSPTQKIYGTVRQPISIAKQLASGVYSIKIILDKEYTTKQLVITNR